MQSGVNMILQALSCRHPKALSGNLLIKVRRKHTQLFIMGWRSTLFDGSTSSYLRITGRLPGL